MQLQLFAPDESPSTNPSYWTLRQAWEWSMRPKLERLNRSPGTLDKYRKAVDYWEQVTDDPPIGIITHEQLNLFPELLLARRNSIHTHTAANQQLMYAQAILARALDAAPKGDPLPKQERTRRRRIIPADAIAAMYRECRILKWSTDLSVPTPLIWRTLLIVLLQCLPRRNEALLLGTAAYHPEPDFPELSEAEVDCDVTSPQGWLVYHTPKTKRIKNGLPLVLPVSPVLQQHLVELLRYSPNRLRLFPLGTHPTTWRKHLMQIQRAAGIDSPYTFQEFRKTGNRLMRRLAGRDVAMYFAGHAKRGINEDYYDDLTEEAVEAAQRWTFPGRVTL